MIALYHQTKTLISFWYKRGLNPKSLIQPSETLLIELTRTHENVDDDKGKRYKLSKKGKNHALLREGLAITPK